MIIILIKIYIFGSVDKYNKLIKNKKINAFTAFPLGLQVFIN
ncbi:MAG: hypothetical protein CM15mP63_4880 [Gammaproteobacteria bacterium]|nr:MAG: hypothetical protein CM15mP63_4880 [Gammaproteobacteria bacterium]